MLARNRDDVIDGFKGRDGIIRDCFPGVLSAPPRVRPRPFEVILESPAVAPVFLKERALVVAILIILSEHRRLQSFAPNL